MPGIVSLYTSPKLYVGLEATSPVKDTLLRELSFKVIPVAVLLFTIVLSGISIVPIAAVALLLSSTLLPLLSFKIKSAVFTDGFGLEYSILISSTKADEPPLTLNIIAFTALGVVLPTLLKVIFLLLSSITVVFTARFATSNSIVT